LNLLVNQLALRYRNTCHENARMIAEFGTLDSAIESSY